jgi:hypothetical protein
MAIKAAASDLSFNTSALRISTPSFNDFHLSKLGFTQETLRQRLPFGPAAFGLHISFEKLCHHILTILHDEWNSHPNKIILCRTNSVLILDCWNCGLPEGENYHATTTENKKLSWVDQFFQALQKNGYILSFKTDEGHIWIDKNTMITGRLASKSPEQMSPFCEGAHVQKSDAPSSTSEKGKDIPLSPPSYFKEIDPSKLGFTQETLDQIEPFGRLHDRDRSVRFETLCEILLLEICKQFCVYENTLFLDATNEGFILDSLDYGLPSGEKYHTTTPDNKKHSWLYQILEALEKKYYILSFEINEKFIGIEKSKRTPEVIPVPSQAPITRGLEITPVPSQALITRVPEIKPAFSYPVPTDALPNFKYLKSSKLDFTPETFELTHALSSSASGRIIRFQNLCDRILGVVRSAFKWRRDNNILLDGSSDDNFFDVLDCGLPSGKTYHTATPEMQKQSWVYQIFKALERTRYIKSFAIENKGKTQIRIVV